MTYFNPHTTPEMRALSRRILAANLTFIAQRGSFDLAGRIARMPTETPQQLAAARAASETERYRIKAQR